MKIICDCCGRQAIPEETNISDPYVTTLFGARTSFSRDRCICGHCAEDLDENGLFPEEQALVNF